MLAQARHGSKRGLSHGGRSGQAISGGVGQNGVVIGRGPRILLVEDDGPIRSALDVALRGEGYEVRAEADGSNLENVAASFRPDLAILDVRLPEGPDGYAMAKLIRSSSDIPLLFLTAADSIEDRLAGFDAGADDYLVKPFAMAELLARVQALLRRAGRLATGW